MTLAEAFELGFDALAATIDADQPLPRLAELLDLEACADERARDMDRPIGWMAAAFVSAARQVRQQVEDGRPTEDNYALAMTVLDILRTVAAVG